MNDRHQKRLEKLKSMLAAQGEDSFLRFALAKELTALGQIEEATKEYMQLLAHDPDYLGAYYHFAQLLFHANDKESALAIGEVGIELAITQDSQKDKEELIHLLDSF